MKKIYYLLTACFVIMAFSACSLKEDESFGTPASQRSSENIAAVQKLLYTAPNGWLMEYYGNLSFGGYNVMVKFEGENATFASEKWGYNHVAGIDDATGKAITTTSHFKIEQSMGTVISFDEYNETFHYYSMPNNPDYTYDTAEGLSGDFEFRVMKATNDSIILRGKKNNNKIVMTPIPAEKTWESIITEAAETETYMSSRSYTLAGSGYTGQEVTATSNGGYRCFIFTYKDEYDQKVTVSAPYIVKKDGFYFYRPVEVNGVELDGLLKGETDDYFIFANNPDIQLDTYMPTLYESIVTANWYMRYGSVGEYAKPKWDAMLEILKTAGRNHDEVKIYTATIGLSGDNKLCSSMSTSTDAPYWGFTGEDVKGDGTRIKFNQNSTVRNKAGKDYYNKYKWNDVLNCIYGHTFDLTCDYQRRPSWIKMTDVNEPTNVITIYATPSYFMEDMSYYQDNK